MRRWLLTILLLLVASVSQCLAQPPLPRKTYPAPYNTRQYYSDVIANLTHYCTSSSPANTYSCVVDNGEVSPLTLVAGQLYVLTVSNTNTGPATLNPSSLGAKPIKRFIGMALADIVAGDLPAGKQIDLRYDGTNFQLVAAAKAVPSSTPLTDAATVTPNFDTTDLGALLTLSQTTTFAAPQGVPVNYQRLMLRVTSSTPQTLIFASAYSTTGLPLPTTTTGGGVVNYFLFAWNSTSNKLDYLGSTQPGLTSTPPTAGTQVFISDSTSVGTWRDMVDCQGAGKAMQFTAAGKIFGCTTLASGAPTTSKYLLQQADGSLPNAQAMGALGTGLVLNTTTTGVQSIYGGTSGTGVLTALSAAGAGTYSLTPTLNTITPQAATNLTLNAGSGNQHVVLNPTGTGGVGIWGAPGTDFFSIATLLDVHTSSGSAVRLTYDSSGVLGTTNGTVNGMMWPFITTLYMGTASNHPVIVRTNNADRVTITALGQVQIEALKTTGSATGKKMVCYDVTTGQLYASTSSVDCLN